MQDEEKRESATAYLHPTLLLFVIFLMTSPRLREVRLTQAAHLLR
jgi:hypothetical protein